MSVGIVLGAAAGALLWACADEAAGPCATAYCVESLPARISGTTAGGSSSAFDRYGCDPSANLSGPDAVYRVTLPTEGFLAVARTSTPPPGSVLRLLRTDDPASCVDGHPSRVGARLPAGDYVVVVDGPPGAEGSFDLQMALVTPSTFEAAGVAPELASDALTIFANAWAWGATRRFDYAMTDFTLHSAVPREWVFDLSTAQLLWNLRVAHGRRSSDPSDLARAVTFSNESGSNESSLGLLRSAGPYVGTFGPSFRLEGLEPGFDDHVCDRDIVMHPWSPMGDDYVSRCGWARPSLGCPAIDSLISMPVRDRLARPESAGLEEGALMLFWYPGTDWRASSEYLHATSPSPALLAQTTQLCDSSQDGTPTPPASGDYGCD